MSGTFMTDLWSKEILDNFWQSTTMAGLLETELNAGDTFTDAHGTVSYEPAVTWARLCGVTVTRPQASGSGYLRLSQPDRVAVMLHEVHPDQLIEAIRAYASNDPVPHLFMRANSLARINVHGR